MSHELVSIVIPCHNARQWIGESIASALAQTWPHAEVIVIDDGSTDGSREVIATFGDQVRTESGPNRGGSAARNRGLALARGRWIQFLDADDVLLPDCVERKLAATKDPGVVVCCNVEFMPFTPRNGEAGGPACWQHAAHDLDHILSHGAPQTSAPLHRREHLEAIGGFREGLRHAQDLDLHLRLAIERDLRFQSHGHPGVRIRPHHESVSRTAGAKMHLAIAETLLHGARLLEQRGRMTEERRVRIAQRVVTLSRRASQNGALDEAVALAADARKLSPRGHEQAYGSRLAFTMARTCGFRCYEMLSGRWRRLRRSS